MSGSVGAHPRRGLVLGAGAAVGGAWAVGVLCALAEGEGFDATAVDVVVGTSAGSVLAALIGAGVPPRVMEERLSGGPVGPVETGAVSPIGVHDHVHRALSDIPRPVPLPGNLRLAARTVGRPGQHTLRTAAAALAPRGRGSLAPVGELIEELCGGCAWPARPRTWLVAMDFDTGRRVAFGAAGQPAPSLAEAVIASCSVPGLFPPRLIGNHRYVDGGVVSVTNADLLADEGLDEVLVLAPMAMDACDPRRSTAARLDRRLRQRLTQRLRWETAELALAGTSVRVIVPTGEDLVAMGTNLMDPHRRRRVFETAVRTTTSRRSDTEPSPIRDAGVDRIRGTGIPGADLSEPA